MGWAGSQGSWEGCLKPVLPVRTSVLQCCPHASPRGIFLTQLDNVPLLILPLWVPGPSMPPALPWTNGTGATLFVLSSLDCSLLQAIQGPSVTQQRATKTNNRLNKTLIKKKKTFQGHSGILGKQEFHLLFPEEETEALRCKVTCSMAPSRDQFKSQTQSSYLLCTRLFLGRGDGPGVASIFSLLI